MSDELLPPPITQSGKQTEVMASIFSKIAAQRDGATPPPAPAAPAAVPVAEVGEAEAPAEPESPATPEPEPAVEEVEVAGKKLKKTELEQILTRDQNRQVLVSKIDQQMGQLRTGLQQIEAEKERIAKERAEIERSRNEVEALRAFQLTQSDDPLTSYLRGGTEPDTQQRVQAPPTRTDPGPEFVRKDDVQRMIQEALSGSQTQSRQAHVEASFQGWVEQAIAKHPALEGLSEDIAWSVAGNLMNSLQAKGLVPHRDLTDAQIQGFINEQTAAVAKRVEDREKQRTGKVLTQQKAALQTLPPTQAAGGTPLPSAPPSMTTDFKGMLRKSNGSISDFMSDLGSRLKTGLTELDALRRNS